MMAVQDALNKALNAHVAENNIVRFSNSAT